MNSSERVVIVNATPHLINFIVTGVYVLRLAQVMLAPPPDVQVEMTLVIWW